MGSKGRDDPPKGSAPSENDLIAARRPRATDALTGLGPPRATDVFKINTDPLAGIGSSLATDPFNLGSSALTGLGASKATDVFKINTDPLAGIGSSLATDPFNLGSSALTGLGASKATDVFKINTDPLAGIGSSLATDPFNLGSSALTGLGASKATDVFKINTDPLAGIGSSLATDPFNLGSSALTGLGASKATDVFKINTDPLAGIGVPLASDHLLFSTKPLIAPSVASNHDHWWVDSNSGLGLSDRVRSAIGPSLTANTEASHRLSEQLDAIGRSSATPPADSLIRVDAPRVWLPDPLPNPVHETNERLAGISEHIEQMRSLAATTAEMQRSLNEVARAILTEFSVGAGRSERATRRGLWIAVTSAVLAGVAIIASLWGVMYQDDQSRKRDIAAAADRVAEQGARERTNEALAALAAAVEKLEKYERAEAATKSRAAPRTPASK